MVLSMTRNFFYYCLFSPLDGKEILNGFHQDFCFRDVTKANTIAHRQEIKDNQGRLFPKETTVRGENTGEGRGRGDTPGAWGGKPITGSQTGRTGRRRRVADLRAVQSDLGRIVTNLLSPLHHGQELCLLQSKWQRSKGEEATKAMHMSKS